MNIYYKIDCQDQTVMMELLRKLENEYPQASFDSFCRYGKYSVEIEFDSISSEAVEYLTVNVMKGQKS